MPRTRDPAHTTYRTSSRTSRHRISAARIRSSLPPHTARSTTLPAPLPHPLSVPPHLPAPAARSRISSGIDAPPPSSAPQPSSGFASAPPTRPACNTPWGPGPPAAAVVPERSPPPAPAASRPSPPPSASHPGTPSPTTQEPSSPSRTTCHRARAPGPPPQPQLWCLVQHVTHLLTSLCHHPQVEEIHPAQHLQQHVRGQRTQPNASWRLPQQSHQSRPQHTLCGTPAPQCHFNL